MTSDTPPRDDERIDWHPSFLRLLCELRSATAGLARTLRVRAASDLQQALDVSPQTVSNWKRRGVPDSVALKAEERFGASAAYIRLGTPHPVSGGLLDPSVRDAGRHSFTLLPPHVDWGQLMHLPALGEFQTTMPDASMEPDLQAGTVVIFVTAASPEPGDWVLCCNGLGEHFVREYRVLERGHWQAHARNPAFLPLDSLQHNLRVIAVFDGFRGRKARCAA